MFSASSSAVKNPDFDFENTGFKATDSSEVKTHLHIYKTTNF